MSNETQRRWYQPTLIEWCVIGLIVIALVFLLQPALQNVDRSHVETRTTRNRAGIWISAAIEFDKQQGRSIDSVEELEAFVFSDACTFCNVQDVRFDWWGTPFRIWIDESESGLRELNVQSARWNREFDDADRTWTRTLRDTPAHDATDNNGAAQPAGPSDSAMIH